MPWSTRSYEQPEHAARRSRSQPARSTRLEPIEFGSVPWTAARRRRGGSGCAAAEVGGVRRAGLRPCARTSAGGRARAVHAAAASLRSRCVPRAGAPHEAGRRGIDGADASVSRRDRVRAPSRPALAPAPDGSAVCELLASARTQGGLRLRELFEQIADASGRRAAGDRLLWSDADCDDRRSTLARLMNATRGGSARVLTLCASRTTRLIAGAMARASRSREQAPTRRRRRQPRDAVSCRRGYGVRAAGASATPAARRRCSRTGARFPTRGPVARRRAWSSRDSGVTRAREPHFACTRRRITSSECRAPTGRA